jgi:hypothetical protein
MSHFAPGAAGWGPPLAPPPPPPAAPHWTPWAPQRIFQLDRSRLLPTLVVALIVAGVVLGGIGLDRAIAAPSAGTVAVGGSVTITAAPGWVLAPSQDVSTAGIELQKGDAILTAEVVASSYSGDSASMLAHQKQSLDAQSVQIAYGDVRTTSIGGHDTTFVMFEATVASGEHSGIVDGELVCMVVDGNAVVLMVAAPQGDLDPVIDDVSAMLVSVGDGR